MYRVLWTLLGVIMVLPAAAQEEGTPSTQEKAKANQEEDPWLGPEAPSPYLSIGYGQDEREYRVGTLSVAVPLSGGPRLNLSMDQGRTRDDERVAYYRAGISSDPLADQVVSLDGIVRNTPGPDSREAQLQTRRYMEAWDLSFRLRGGRVTFENQLDSGGTEEQTGHRAGTGLGVGYATGPVYFRVQGIEYFYRWEDQEPDSSSGETGLPFLSDARGSSGGSAGGSQREPVLTKREATASVTFFSGPWDWQLGAQHIRDTDSGKQNLVLLGTSYQTSGGHSLGLNLDIPTGDAPAFAQVVVGIEL